MLFGRFLQLLLLLPPLQQLILGELLPGKEFSILLSLRRLALGWVRRPLIMKIDHVLEPLMVGHGAQKVVLHGIHHLPQFLHPHLILLLILPEGRALEGEVVRTFPLLR